MGDILLTAEERKLLGTRASKRLRKSGIIPCVMNSRKDGTVHLSVNLTDLMRTLKKGERVIDLKHPGGQDKVFIQEVIHDHLGEDIYHVNFNKIALDEEVVLPVPVILKGKPAGVVDDGGTLDQYVRELRVSCLPVNIPKEIAIDVTNLKLNEKLAVKNIPAIPGVKILQDADIVIASVTTHVVEEVVTAAAATTEAGAAGPEVIKKEPKAGEEETDEKAPKAKEEEKGDAKAKKEKKG